MQIGLGDMFLAAFGYRSEAFDPSVDDVRGVTSGKRTERGHKGSPYYAKNSVGREYYMPVEVVVGNGKMANSEQTFADFLGVYDAQGKATGRWWLPNPIVSISMKPRIIDTDLTERNGPVSELIGLSGYKITVRGFLMNHGAKEFPEEEWRTMNRLPLMKVPVRINSVKTDELLLDSGNTGKLVTIRDVSFPELVGVKHVQPYVLELWSNEDYNLVEIV